MGIVTTKHESDPGTGGRGVIFISHANPEDNACSDWLAHQLLLAGYEIWCDIRTLRGGEDFWKDIEASITTRVVKLVYVLTRRSNEKDGPRRELKLSQDVGRALGLSDMVIPAIFDDLQHSEMNIELSRLNAIPFSGNWAHGLKTLIEKLERDHVPRMPTGNNLKHGRAVGTWHRQGTQVRPGITEDYISNLYPIECTARALHSYKVSMSALPPGWSGFGWPAISRSNVLFTFVPPDQLGAASGAMRHLRGFTFTEALDDDRIARVLRIRPPRGLLTSMFRSAWEGHVRARGLPCYDLSSGKTCAYFRKGFTQDDTVKCSNLHGLKIARQLVGQSTLRRGEERIIRHWHFAIRASFVETPSLGFCMNAHVLFSDDGANPWPDPKKMHRARRRLCKGWWNDVWRDRMLASIAWIADGKATIDIRIAPYDLLRVSALPTSHTMPLSYDDPSDDDPADEVDEPTIQDPDDPELERSLVSNGESA